MPAVPRAGEPQLSPPATMVFLRLAHLGRIVECSLLSGGFAAIPGVERVGGGCCVFPGNRIKKGYPIGATRRTEHVWDVVRDTWVVVEVCPRARAGETGGWGSA